MARGMLGESSSEFWIMDVGFWMGKTGADFGFSMLGCGEAAVAGLLTRIMQGALIPGVNFL